jgi:hypothetical protein
MHVVAPRAVAQPQVRADESAVAVEGVAHTSAAAVAQRRIQPADDGDGVAGDRRQPRDGHELRARDMEVRTAKAMREPDGSIDLLPSYEYAVGPDGLPYVIGQGEGVEPPKGSPSPPIEAEAPPVQRDAIEREPVEREPIERERVEREPPAPADDHVTRSYTKLVEREPPTKLDTIA